MNIFNNILKKIDDLIDSCEFSIGELNFLVIIFPTKRSIREFQEQFKRYFSKKYDFFSYPKCISVKNIKGSLTNQERFSICWILLSKYFPELSKSKLVGYIEDCFDFLDSYYYGGLQKKSISNYKSIFSEAEFLEWFINGYEALLDSIDKKDPIIENAEYLDRLLSSVDIKKIFWVGFRRPFKIFENLMNKYFVKSTVICNELDINKNIELLEVKNIYDESNIISILCRKFATQKKTVMIISNDKHIIKNISIKLSMYGIFIDSSVNKNFSDTFCGDFFKSLFNFLIEQTVINFLILLDNDCLGFENTLNISEFIKNNNLIKTQFNDIAGNSDFLALIKNFDTEKIKEILKFINISDKSFSYSLWSNSLKNLVKLLIKDSYSCIFSDIFDYLENCNNLIFEDLTLREFKEICLKYLSYYEYEIFDQDYTKGIRSFGFLESRLLSSDIVIIASCTDDNFPVKKKENFFISDSFKKVLKINFDDDLINDFFDLVSNTKDNIFITKIHDNGFKTKFIHDIEKILGTLKYNTELYKEYLDLEYKLRLGYTGHKKAEKPSLPSPNPLKKIRPKRFSCTDIEYLVKNPYAIYVKYLLRLKEINYLKNNASIIKGNVIHKVLENILKCGISKPFKGMYSDFWAFSIDHIVKWVVNVMKNRNIQKSFAEIKGEIDFENFSIFGVADRIDVMQDKSVVIVDYKTGALPSKKSIIDFTKPQLLIESVILMRGGFKGVNFNNINFLEFWKIGKSCSVTKVDISKYDFQSEKKLKELLEKYQEIPYKAYIKKYQYMQNEPWFHLSRAIEIM